jgi:hypothetical protein
MDSSVLLLQQGHLPTSVPPLMIDAHQKHDSHIKNSLLWLVTAIERASPLIKMN